jgi:S-adenosylmethionine hydrolase
VAPPVISLLTDFGLRDPSAAICKGVILGIAPEARVIDISHEVRKYAVRDGALLLWCALPYLPVGWHVAVVDPGVGTDRLPIAIRVARGDVLIGPDNGLLLPAADRLGGAREARVLEAEAYRLPVVTASFHGRDIFAPAAAHLATGVPLEALGRTVPIGDLVDLAIPEPRVTPDRLESAIVYIDTFGNVKLAGLTADLEAALGPVRAGDPLKLEFGAHGGATARRERVTWQTTFGAVGAGVPLLYEDSYGRICLADNRGNAASRLGLVDDQPVAIRRAG